MSENANISINVSKDSPILLPIRRLFFSRKVAVAVAILLLAMLYGASPEELTQLAETLGKLVIATIAGEDIAEKVRNGKAE